MDTRVLVLDALRGEPTQRVPVLGPGGLINILNNEIAGRMGVPLSSIHYSGEMMAEMARTIRNMVGYDNLSVPLCTTVEAEILGARIDMGGPSSLPRVSATASLDFASIRRAARSVSASHGRIPAVLKAVNILKLLRPRLPIFGNVMSPATLLVLLVRTAEIMDALRRRGKELENSLEAVEGLLSYYVEVLVENGVDVIMVNDQVSTGEILEEESFQQLSLDLLEEIAQDIHRAGAAAVLHLCGNAELFFERLRTMEFDCFSFDHRVDVGMARSELGKPIIGCVNPTLINYYPPEMVLEDALLTIRKGASLLSPPCGLGMEAPLQNLKVICEAVRHFRP